VFGFAKLEEEHRMTCDTSKMDGLNVHAGHGTIKFMKDDSGPCTCVFSEEHKQHVEEEKKKMKQEQQHAMTQEEKMSCCTPAQIEAASQRSKNSLSKCQSADSGKFQGNNTGQHD